MINRKMLSQLSECFAVSVSDFARLELNWIEGLFAQQTFCFLRPELEYARLNTPMHSPVGSTFYRRNAH
jgi:hypothetical protein